MLVRSSDGLLEISLANKHVIGNLLIVSTAPFAQSHFVRVLGIAQPCDLDRNDLSPNWLKPMRLLNPPGYNNWSKKGKWPKSGQPQLMTLSSGSFLWANWEASALFLVNHKWEKQVVLGACGSQLVTHHRRQNQKTERTQGPCLQLQRGKHLPKGRRKHRNTFFKCYTEI